MSKVDQIIDQLKELTLLEASELVKAIETTFDVSAAAPVAQMAAAAAPAAAVEEKTEFTVKVTGIDASKKIAVIKEVKNILNIGLADAKTKVESGEFLIAENVKKEEAEDLKNKLSAAGATVVLV